MNTSLQILLGFLLLLLTVAGCTPLRQDFPAPEPARTTTAASMLLEQAKAQAGAGQFDQAGATLERALRIEPHNPLLWQELARVRINQGQYRQAENLAAKSNALAGDHRQMQARNWQIIGQARTRLGDPQGAKAAFERAGEL
ncbi:MAG: tetratricopeptide repeat protein [Desulfovibrionales bacterium]